MNQYSKLSPEQSTNFKSPDFKKPSFNNKYFKPT